MHILIALLLSLSLAACASTSALPPPPPDAPPFTPATGPAINPCLDPNNKCVDPMPSVPAAAPPSTPLQKAAAALDALANNPLLAAVNKDATDTLAWVASPQGPTDPLAILQASVCPSAVQKATASLQQNIAMLKGLLLSVDAQAQGIGSGQVEIILALTKLRYGTQGQVGSDPSSLISSQKAIIGAQITAVMDMCRSIFPAKQVGEILKQMAAAGIGVSSMGAAAPLIPFITALP